MPATVAFTLVAGAPAYGGDAPSAAAVVNATGPAQIVTQIPFKEQYHATGTITASASCPAGTFLVSLDGGGTATHVGSFTGGTGRFAGATGTHTMAGTQVTESSLPDWPTEVTLRMEGTASSVGSGR